MRHAFRLLWKSKGFTATTRLTLGLCIGATTAIFSTVYSLMLNPLPFLGYKITPNHGPALFSGRWTLDAPASTTRSVYRKSSGSPPSLRTGLGLIARFVLEA